MTGSTDKSQDMVAPQDAVGSVDSNGMPDISVGESIDYAAALQELRNEVVAAQDRELRAHAELDNFRKRSSRQLEEERKYAAVPIMRELLGVVDNLERAVLSSEQAGDAQGLLDGVRLVNQQLQRILEQHHCRRIVALGQLFDPSVHQAIGQMPSDQYATGCVLQEVQTGYQLHDRVIRPVLVLVSTGPTPASGSTREEPS